MLNSQGRVVRIPLGSPVVGLSPFSLLTGVFCSSSSADDGTVVRQSFVSEGRLHHGQVRMGFREVRLLNAFHYSLTPMSFQVAILQFNTAVLVVLTTRCYAVSIGQ